MTINRLTHSLTLWNSAVFEQRLLSILWNIYICFLIILWEVDPFYNKIKANASQFPDIVEKRLMGFKIPKSHGDIVKTMNIFSITSKVTKLAKHLEKKFMLSSHTKPLEDLISSVSRYICKYNYKLKTQRISNLRLHEN